MKYALLILLSSCALHSAPRPDPDMAMARMACSLGEITGCLLLDGVAEDDPRMIVAKFSERWNAEHMDRPGWQVDTGL